MNELFVGFSQSLSRPATPNSYIAPPLSSSGKLFISVRIMTLISKGGGSTGKVEGFLGCAAERSKLGREPG